MTFITTVLLIILAWAVVADLLYRKIPNLLTLPAMLFGIAYHSCLTGLAGFGLSTGGLAVGVGLLFAFYLAGMMGAGDVKLMGAVGSLLGPAGVLQAFLFTAFAGGVYAVIVLAVKGRLKVSAKRILSMLFLSIVHRKPILFADEEQAPSPVLCYGVAIALGTVASMFFKI